MAAGWLLLVSSLVLIINIHVHAAINVNITILESAVAKGAVCLDGTPPAYYYFEGCGSGATNWIVFLAGGGWCTSGYECQVRSLTKLGSSQAQGEGMTNITFSGLLDNDCTLNPDFCNWHKVYVRYCDGSSFLSDVEEVDHKNNITQRGARIFNAMMDEFVSKGIGEAENAVLSGSSAGGLATILHCDLFREFLPDTSRVKCIADSGFFIHGEGLPGLGRREVNFAQYVINTHKLVSTLPASCTRKRSPYLCLFPEYLVEDIETPLFIIESAFDSYQVPEHFLKGIYHTYEYQPCTDNLTVCNATLIGLMEDFGRTFRQTLMKLDDCPSRGMFVHSCFRHTHLLARDGWICSSIGGNVLENKTIGEAVGDWYFDRSSFDEIDKQNQRPLNCTLPLSDQCFYEKCLASLH